LLFGAVLLAFPALGQGEDWPSVISSLKRQSSRGNKKQLAIAHNNYGIELSDEGNWRAAEQELQKALSLDSKNARFKQNLAMVYLNHAFELSQQRQSSSYSSYRHRNAKRLAEKALRYNGKLVEAYVLIGDIEYENQQLRQAKAAWAKAQRIDSSVSGLDERMKKLNTEYAVEKQFDRTGNAFFDLRYQDDINRSTAFDLAKTLAEARRDVGRDLNYRPRHKIVVLIYSQAGFAKVRRGPDWAAGIYDGKIRVPYPATPAAQSSVKPTLYHEYTHALIHDMTDNRCPVWFNEGIAEYQEAKIRAASLGRLRTAARVSRLIPLESLNAGFKSSNAEVASLAYQQSYSVVHYLAKKYGFARIRRMLEKMGAGSSFDDALQKELRLSLGQLEKRWRSWLPSFVR
jgi:tetratricopeptide (TPR) repeat protein